MDHRDAANRDLLIGLLALQNGMVEQDVLVAAFRSWTRDKSRPIVEILAAQGAIDVDDRALLEGLARKHLKRHGGDAERSLAALDAARSTRESLGEIGDPDIEATLGHVGSGSADEEADRTGTYHVGGTASDGARFRVLRPHARGGLGAVFVALDEELHREVALKQILDHHADDPISRTRFVLEAEITGGLEHPGIVPVYGLGSYKNGRPYYAMRFVRGDSLKEAIVAFHADAMFKTDPGARSLALRKLLRRFVDVCNAIDYAHTRGVLHRDIKPANIILGKHGETLVVDWGLAKLMGKADPGSASDERTLVPSSASGSAETLPGSALGTPAYMSPEQAAGDLVRLGPRSDVYSLGATLYCLLTGRLPFEGDDIGEVLRKVQLGEFSRPRQLATSLDKAVEAVCLKAMATRPEDRFASCRELAEDVERWMADEPVTSWREPFSRKARRWARRNRTFVMAAAVALLAGVVGLSALAAVQSKANRNLRTANAATTKAKNETEAALAQSEESRKQTEVVSTFLIEVFRSPDPSQDGRAIRVADMLDRASERLDTDFAGSPVTKAAMLNALGETYLGLGLYDSSEASHAKASALREAALGPNHADTLTSRNNLAEAYLAGGRTAEAVSLHEETLRLWGATLGPDHPHTLVSRNNLGTAYYASGRYADAIALAEETFRVREATLGANHVDTLTSRNNLAQANLAAGNTAEAVRMHEAGLKLWEAKLGSDHVDTLTIRNNLATAYYASGRYADSIVLDEKTLGVRESKLGASHPHTLTTRNNLAEAYLSVGRTAEAVANHEQLLKLWGAKLGPNHPSTLASRNNLANAYLADGRADDAVRVHESTLRLKESTLAPDHPDILISRNNLAQAYLAADRTPEAVVLHEQSRKLWEAKLGPDHPSTLVSRNNLAQAYLAAGRASEAVALHEGTLRVRETTLGPDHPHTLVSRNNLAKAYESLGRWGDAEVLWRAALASRRKTSKPESPLLAGDLVGLGYDLLKQAKWSEAETVLREGLAIREKKLPENWSRFDTMSLLGWALLGDRRYAEAEPLVVQGFDGMKAREAKIPASGKVRLSEAAERVVWLYVTWGKPDQAAAWKAKLELADLPADVFAK